MKTVTKKKLYEAMFLVDSADAGSDWDGIVAAITKILKKAKVEIVSIRKWDDRRLAYEIRGKSRGTYLLCYFRSDGRRNQEIEKAVQISEKIIRVLILCVDWMTDEDIEKDTPAMRAEKEKEEREVSREADDAAEPESETSEEAEPDEEPESDEEVDEADAGLAREDAVEVQATDTASKPKVVAATEPDEEETDDSQESQPKVAADD